MQVENKEYCTGCGACFNICPKGAITMQGDEYGFYKPVIDKDKCINCGLCKKVCPLDKYKSQNIEQPKVFAFQNDDEDTLYKCASGGAFASFAKHIIEQGGIVYGVIYDENIIACHSRTDNLTDLEKMLSSKYVQSDTKDTFKQAKDDLENGRTVLFSGTPCQIAGLKSYLQKDYENLLTADIVCHGVPSPLVFEKYKAEFMSKKQKEENLLNIDFRSKIYGWSNHLYTEIKTNNNQIYSSMKKDDFMRTFLSNLSINYSCLSCQFNKLPRVADLSLADFWGVDEYDKSMNDNKGLSLVLINSDKGNKLFEKINKKCLLKEIPLSYAIKCNPNICSSSVPSPKREEFLEDIKNGKSLQYCVKKYCREPLHIVIYRLLPRFAKDFIKYKILKSEKA